MFENLFLKFVFQTSKTVFLRHISTKQPTDNKSTTTPTTNQSYPLEFSQQSNKENPTRCQNKEIFYYIKKKKKKHKNAHTCGGFCLGHHINGSWCGSTHICGSKTY